MKSYDPQTDVIEGREGNVSRETGSIAEERRESALCISEKTKARFWSKVDVRGPDECWEWQGSRNEDGYGSMYFENKKTIPTHRISFLLHHDEEITGWLVCHHCDNPPCCNPRHLFRGTCGDNTRDMVAKGRHFIQVDPSRIMRGDKHPNRLHPERMARGDRHGTKTHPEKHACGEMHENSKLTEAQIIEMRRLYIPRKVSCESLGKMYGVAMQTVHKIISRKAWNHIQ